MGDDDAAICFGAGMFWKNIGDMLVGEAVKAVTLNAFVIIPIRQGQSASYFGDSVVKCCVEAGNLLHFWIKFSRFLDQTK